MKQLLIIAVILLSLPMVAVCQPDADAPRPGFERIVEVGPGNGPMNCGPAGMQRGPMGRGGMDCCDMERGMKGHGGRGLGMGMLFMAEELELTADQKAKIAKMQTDFQLAMIDQQAKVSKARVMLRDIMHDDKAAGATVEAKIDEMAKARAEMAKMKYRHHEAVKALLTDKQKETLKTLLEKGPMMKRIKEIRIMDNKAPHEHEG